MNKFLPIFAIFIIFFANIAFVNFQNYSILDAKHSFVHLSNDDNGKYISSFSSFLGYDLINYSTILENVTLVRSLAVLGDSVVYMRNVVVPNDTTIIIVVSEFGTLYIENITAPYGPANIEIFIDDLGWVFLREIYCENISLTIEAYSESYIDFSNVSIGDFSFYGSDYSYIFMSGINSFSSARLILEDLSYIEIFGSDIYITSSLGSFQVDLTGFSYGFISHTNFHNDTYIILEDFSDLDIFDTYYRTSFEINVLAHYSPLYISNSNVSMISAPIFDIYYNYSPYDYLGFIWDSNISVIDSKAPGIFVLGNTTVDTAFLPIIVKDDGFIDNGTAYIGRNGFGPYPVKLLNGSTINTIYNYSIYYILNVSNPNLVKDTNITTLGGRFSVLSLFKFEGFFSSASEIFIIDSVGYVVNSSIDNLHVMDSTIYIDNSTMSYLDLYNSKVYFENSTISAYLSTILESSSVSFRNFVIDSSGSISIYSYWSNITVNKSILSGSLNLWNSTLLVNNSNISLLTIDMDYESICTLLNSEIGSLYYPISVVNGFISINNSIVLSGSNYSMNLNVSNSTILDVYIKELLANYSKVYINNSNILEAYLYDSTVDIENSIIDSVSVYNSNITIYESTINYNLFIGNGSWFNLTNVVSWGSIQTVANNFDFKKTFVNGVIIGSNLGSVIFVANGTLNISDSSIYFLLTALCDARIDNSFVSNLANISYLYSGAASIVKDIPTGFDGSFISIGVGVTILQTYNGFVVFGGTVSVINSSLVGFIAYDNSIVRLENVVGYSDTFNAFIFDNSKVSANNVTISPIFIDQSILMAFDNSNLTIINSVVDVDILLYDNSLLRAYNTTFTSVYGFSLNGSISIFGENISFGILSIDAPFGIFNVSDLKTSGDGFSSFSFSFIDGVLDINNITANGFLVMYVIGASGKISSNPHKQIGILNILNSTLRINNLNASNIWIYNSNMTIYNSTISYLSTQNSYTEFENGSLDFLYADYSNLFVNSSDVQYIGLFSNNSLLAENSNISALEELFEIYALYLSSKAIPLAYNTPLLGNSISIVNSTILTPIQIQALSINGTGIFVFDNWRTTTYGSVIVKNHTSIIFNNSYPMDTAYLGLSIYLNGYTKHIISNFEDVRGSIILFMTVDRMFDINDPIGVANISYVETELGITSLPVGISFSDDGLIAGYEIYVNGTLIEEGEVYSQLFVIDFDLAPYLLTTGIYFFDFLAYDLDENFAVVSIVVYVYPSEPPQISVTPKALEFEIGMPSEIVGYIEWTVIDKTPTIYEIYVNGSLRASGFYSSGEVIMFDVVGNLTEPGTYNITLVAYDAVGNMAKSSVKVTVYPSQAPIFVRTPENATINVGEKINLTWIGEDLFPATYTISVNNTPVVSDEPWLSDQEIVFTFSANEPGLYAVKIALRDKAGNVAENIVYINVVKPKGPAFPYLSIALFGLVSFIIVAVVIYIIRARGRK